MPCCFWLCLFVCVAPSCHLGCAAAVLVLQTQMRWLCLFVCIAYTLSHLGCAAAVLVLQTQMRWLCLFVCVAPIVPPWLYCCCACASDANALAVPLCLRRPHCHTLSALLHSLASDTNALAVPLCLRRPHCPTLAVLLLCLCFRRKYVGCASLFASPTLSHLNRTAAGC